MIRHARLLVLLILTATFGVVEAQSPEQWFRQGQAAVEEAKRLAPITGKARNVILFIGDGMGVSTVTAARILEGQQRGRPGEENVLGFEELPYTAIIKTYNTNRQVPDSAGTMTAMVTGVKTKAGVISMNQKVTPGDHASAAGNKLATILELAELAGLSTGVVTTTRITHATPAACYAHSPGRWWEDDSALPAAAAAADFPDIARQLVEFKIGDGLEVALGGGRAQFLPNNVEDPEEPGKTGHRSDRRNLTAEWLQKPGADYVWNKDQFNAVDVAKTEHLLGLFAPSHMAYEHDRPSDRAGEPSLSEMTTKAIKLLSKNEKGFFLMVEGGRIDHAHHEGNPFRALTDTIEFANAVRAARSLTNRRDTLIIVTADHSIPFTMAGYTVRGNPILGKVITTDSTGKPMKSFDTDALGLPYTTLGYPGGPGYTGASEVSPEGSKRRTGYAGKWEGITKGRPNLTDVDTQHPSYLPECTVPLSDVTHGGEDVTLYADGPHAYLFRGVLEQNVIFHIMAEALGLKRGDDR